MSGNLAVAASAKRKAYVRVVLPLFITSIIAYLDRVNLSYVTSSLKKDLGFDDEVIGFGAGLFFVGYVLFEIPGALIAERFSPKWWIARIMFSWGLVSGLMAFITTTWQFYLLRFLLGIAEASLYPVIYASCIPRWFAPADRARAFAILLTSLQISSVIGAPLAGSLLDIKIGRFEGWQTLFLIESIPALLFAFVIVFWMSDHPNEASWLTEAERNHLQSMLAEEHALKASLPHYSVTQSLTDPKVLMLCVTYFLWITGFWGFTQWMPSALSIASGWSNLAVGWTIVIPMGLSLIFMCWIGHHSSITGEKRWHGAIGLFIGAAGMLLGTMVDDKRLVIAGLCLAAIGVYAPFGVWWSYPSTFLSGAAAAGAVGFINSCGNIGGFLGPYITGFIKQHTGSFTGGWIYLACSLFASGLLMLRLRRI